MSLYKISTRGLLARSLYKLPIRGLFRSLRKSIRALLARSLCKRPIGKISVRDRLARSLDKISIMGLCTMYKISIRGLRGKIPAQALYKRPPCHDLCTRSWWSKWAPHHNESNLTLPKCREGCAIDLKMSTAAQPCRAICEAQSDGRVAQAIAKIAARHKEGDAEAQSAEKVARAIAKWAPRHKESDVTGTKCRKVARESPSQRFVRDFRQKRKINEGAFVL